MVDFRTDDAIAFIDMDDGKANAFSFEAIASIVEAIDAAEKKEASAIVLSGRDGVFSGGFDLNVMRGGSMDDINRLLSDGAGMLLRILRSPLPVVAACSGHAIAMGLFALLACDMRIGASGDFKLVANETAIGMPLPVFGVELPRARIDPRVFHDAIVFSRVFSADDAAAVGILSRSVDPASLAAAAREAAAQLGELPRGSFAANKALSNAPIISAIEAVYSA